MVGLWVWIPLVMEPQAEARVPGSTAGRGHPSRDSTGEEAGQGWPHEAWLTGDLRGAPGIFQMGCRSGSDRTNVSVCGSVTSPALPAPHACRRSSHPPASPPLCCQAHQAPGARAPAHPAVTWPSDVAPTQEPASYPGDQEVLQHASSALGTTPTGFPQPPGARRPPLPTQRTSLAPPSLCLTQGFLSALPTAFPHGALCSRVTGPAMLSPQVTAACPSSQPTSWKRSCHCPTQGVTLRLPPLTEAYDLQPAPCL